MVIASRNPVHSVLFLILAFVNAAGLFVLLGAEFLAMILVVVYVGAVAVLFLFVVMMLDVDFAELRQGFLQYLPVGALIGVDLPGRAAAGRRRLDASARGARAVPVAADPPLDESRTPRRSASCSTRATSISSRRRASILLVAMIGAIVLTLRHTAGRQAPEHRAPGRADAERRRSRSARCRRGQGL